MSEDLSEPDALKKSEYEPFGRYWVRPTKYKRRPWGGLSEDGEAEVYKLTDRANEALRRREKAATMLQGIATAPTLGLLASLGERTRPALDVDPFAAGLLVAHGIATIDAGSAGNIGLTKYGRSVWAGLRGIVE